MLRPRPRFVLIAIVCLLLFHKRVALAQVPLVDLTEQGKTFALTLVNEKTGEPMEGVKVNVRFEGAAQQKLLSPADGIVNFDMSTKTRYLYIDANAKGFVPMRLFYQGNAPIPESYTLALEPATTISGNCQLSMAYMKQTPGDQFNGTPIAQATVIVTIEPFDASKIDEPIVVPTIEVKPIAPATQPTP